MQPQLLLRRHDEAGERCIQSSCLPLSRRAAATAILLEPSLVPASAPFTAVSTLDYCLGYSAVFSTTVDFANP